MNTNQEYKAKDTYGSKLRNLLSPFYNVIAAIQSNAYQDSMSIPDEDLLNFFRASCKDLWDTYKKMVDLSYDDHLDKTEYVDRNAINEEILNPLKETAEKIAEKYEKESTYLDKEIGDSIAENVDKIL
jgi:hypothetical protein